MITLTIISLSSGLLSAISSVKATKALSAMRFSPSAFIQKIVALQKLDEYRSGDPFVAVGERVVLDDEIQQVRRLLFNAGI